MRTIDTLKPLTAAEVLAIWQDSRREYEDQLEQTLRCNAQVLAKSCQYQGETVYEDEEAVLADLTPGQMEHLLRCLLEGESPEQQNPAFDPSRFAALKGA